MPSAASSPFPTNSPATSRWREVQSVYRRVCVLRSAGKNEEADQIESTSLSQAIGTLRDSSTITSAQLDALFAGEQERVADARALAEILLPMLLESSFALPLAASPAQISAARVAQPVAAAAAAHDEEKPLRTDHNTGTLPGIADFIDEMLSQDRAARGSRRSA